MSLINFTTREITCKIVYYGPGRSGKTTNLQYIYDRVPEGRRGRITRHLATFHSRAKDFEEAGVRREIDTHRMHHVVGGDEQVRVRLFLVETLVMAVAKAREALRLPGYNFPIEPW